MLTWGFRRYVRRFIRKNFNAVRLSIDSYASFPPSLTGPIVCFANHPGWWDPMTAVFLTDLWFSDRQFAAPIDADALRSYPILERLGFFPVARDSTAGAKQFLSSCRKLFNSPNSILWLTPTGKFCDVRQPSSFMPGLAHVIDSKFSGTVLPVAVEYTFWNERYPELLVGIRSPIRCDLLPDDRAERTHFFETELAAAQRLLATRAIARDPAGFSTITTGNSGIGGIYDGLRRTMAWCKRESFQRHHEH